MLFFSLGVEEQKSFVYHSELKLAVMSLTYLMLFLNLFCYSGLNFLVDLAFFI